MLNALQTGCDQDQLNNASLQMNWNPHNRKETEEAKKLYQDARRQLRLIEGASGELVDSFRQVANKGFFRVKEIQLDPGQVAVRIFNHTGDETVVWDSADPGEAKEAAARFQEYIDKGWKAFAIDPHGGKHRRIRRFDAHLEEVVFEEGVDRSRLKDFAKSFNKVEFLPETWAG